MVAPCKMPDSQTVRLPNMASRPSQLQTADKILVSKGGRVEVIN